MTWDFPYAKIAERTKGIATYWCGRCPRCRKALNPDKRQMYEPRLGLAYHEKCAYSKRNRELD